MKSHDPNGPLTEYGPFQFSIPQRIALGVIGRRGGLYTIKWRDNVGDIRNSTLRALHRRGLIYYGAHYWKLKRGVKLLGIERDDWEVHWLCTDTRPAPWVPDFTPRQT